MTLFGLSLGIVLAVAVVSLFKVIHEQTTREANAKAANSAQVAACFNSVESAPIINGFLHAHETLVNNSLLTTRAAIAVEDKNDPLHKIRVASLRRLIKAQSNTENLKELLVATTPTQDSCIKLAKKVGAPYGQYTTASTKKSGSPKPSRGGKGGPVHRK